MDSGSKSRSSMKVNIIYILLSPNVFFMKSKNNKGSLALSLINPHMLLIEVH